MACVRHNTHQHDACGCLARQVGTYTIVVQAYKSPNMGGGLPAQASVSLRVVNDSMAATLAVHILGSGDPTNFPPSMPLTLQCGVQGDVRLVLWAHYPQDALVT